MYPAPMKGILIFLSTGFVAEFGTSAAFAPKKEVWPSRSAARLTGSSKRSSLLVAFQKGGRRQQPDLFRSKSSSLSSSSSFYDYTKWDNLQDDDDDDEDNDSTTTKKREIPSDMKYELPNIQRQSETYHALSSIGDASLISDVWLQSPGDNTAWFVGRIARISDVTTAQAIERQYPLIERHAWVLRPVELHPSRGPFIVYHAQGNTEQWVANKECNEGVHAPLDIQFTQVTEEEVRGAVNLDKVCVGFRGAVYDDEEDLDAYRVDLHEEDTAKANEESVQGKDGSPTSIDDIDYDAFDFTVDEKMLQELDWQ